MAITLACSGCVHYDHIFSSVVNRHLPCVVITFWHSLYGEREARQGSVPVEICCEASKRPAMRVDMHCVSALIATCVWRRHFYYQVYPSIAKQRGRGPARIGATMIFMQMPWSRRSRGKY